MKNDNGRTYDFCRAAKRPGQSRNAREASQTVLDGWRAYYRWLAALKRRLTAGACQRQPD